jgi:two-component system NtrC family sensor kinase
MPRLPIRHKLLVGLSLVVVMMLTLLGGSIYGLHAFHSSILKLTDQLRELGASAQLLRTVVQLESGRDDTPLGRDQLRRHALDARAALGQYCDQLKANASRGNRDDVRDELGLAFAIDDDLTAILNQLAPGTTVEPLLPGTRRNLNRGAGAPLTLPARIDRLNRHVMSLPNILHRDFFAVLSSSRSQFESSRWIVWVSALAVLAMLGALMMLVSRWVLFPVRLLHRGVRHVAGGDFGYRIALNSGDEMQALATAFNDMTDRIAATYADLERQVQERSRQLVRSERLAGVGFLAAGVAHEINNPLASIALCAEALERRLGTLEGPDAPRVRDYMRMIQDEAFRCKRITEKLLDFSRCGEIQRSRTDLVGLVQGVVEMVQHMGKYRGKAIAFQPRESVVAHADPQEIKQVVLNLVVNALDSMEPGGTLRIAARHADGMAELTFADDGCGMTPEVLENIFEPFFTRRRGGKGTGLGLSITHRIVSQHGGEIAASSPGEGRGATFVVRLPVRPVEPTPAPAPMPPPPAPRALAAAGVG